MTLNRIKWTLFIVPAIVIGLFETIRHTLLEYVLPMEIGNWTAAIIDALVIALISRTLLHRFSKAEQELSEERQAHALLRERERLARVLHDQIAQSIFYSGVQIKTVRKLAHECGSEELNAVLEDVMMSLREMDENLRQSIFNLKSESTLALNLKDRVKSYLEKILSWTELTWEVDFPLDFSWVTPSEQVQLFGVLQESVTNVVKHAHASHVSVRLHTSARHPLEWSFKVEDNGLGFDTNNPNGGHGLDIMAARARDIGAELRIESHPSRTTICVHKGLDEQQSAPEV